MKNGARADVTRTPSSPFLGHPAPGFVEPTAGPVRLDQADFAWVLPCTAFTWLRPFDFEM